MAVGQAELEQVVQSSHPSVYISVAVGLDSKAQTPLQNASVRMCVTLKSAKKKQRLCMHVSELVNATCRVKRRKTKSISVNLYTI